MHPHHFAFLHIFSRGFHSCRLFPRYTSAAAPPGLTRVQGKDPDSRLGHTGSSLSISVQKSQGWERGQGSLPTATQRAEEDGLLVDFPLGILGYLWLHNPHSCPPLQPSVHKSDSLQSREQAAACRSLCGSGGLLSFGLQHATSGHTESFLFRASILVTANSRGAVSPLAQLTP